MRAFMFPGQGSQGLGMGLELFDRYPQLTARADDILGYSVRKLCLEGPKKVLNKSAFTQPALFVVNALAHEHALTQGGPPDYLLGHSLGEYNALLAAGSFDFETGLSIVVRRGQLMGEVTSGSMVAVIGLSEEALRDALGRAGVAETVDIAGFNTPTQILLSGPEADIDRAYVALKGEGVRCDVLNTSGAFHSRYLQQAKLAFADFLQGFAFRSPGVPVISNVTAKPLEADQIHRELADQVTSPVKWSQSVQYLLGLGNIELIEVGHGHVLTRLARHIRGTGSEPRERPSAGGADGAERRIQQWNARYPIGTPVRSSVVGEQGLETRTQALLLFGHRAAVYLKGYEGYFDLGELEPVGS